MYAFSILTGLHFGAADLYQVNPIIKQFPPCILYSGGIMEQISADPSAYKLEFRETCLIKDLINHLPKCYIVLSTACFFQLLKRWPHSFLEQCLIEQTYLWLNIWLHESPSIHVSASLMFCAWAHRHYLCLSFFTLQTEIMLMTSAKFFGNCWYERSCISAAHLQLHLLFPFWRIECLKNKEK